MIFPKGRYGWVIGALLFSLAGCATRPAPNATPTNDSASDSASVQPEPTVQSAPTSIPTQALDPSLDSAADPTSDSSEPIAQTDSDIWSQLRDADTHYYVLMRHGIAPGTGDPADFVLGDCSTQRNLSEEGRAQARRTGALFRQKNVAVDQVLSSEWCRCLDTATLLNLGPVELFPALSSFFQNRAQGPEQTERLREFMVEHQDDQQVTMMVTHFVNISAIAGSGVSSGEMVVMQVNDRDEVVVVDRIEER